MKFVLWDSVNRFIYLHKLLISKICLRSCCKFLLTVWREWSAYCPHMTKVTGQPVACLCSHRCEVEAQLHTFATSALKWGWCSQNHVPVPAVQRTGCASESGWAVWRILPPPEFNPPTIHPVANRYTDCVIHAASLVLILWLIVLNKLRSLICSCVSFYNRQNVTAFSLLAR